MANTIFTASYVARMIATEIVPELEGVSTSREIKPPSDNVTVRIENHSMSLDDFRKDIIKPAAKALLEAIAKKTGATMYAMEVPEAAYRGDVFYFGPIPIRVIPQYDLGIDATTYRVSIALH